VSFLDSRLAILRDCLGSPRCSVSLSGDSWCGVELFQADPVLQVVGEASPQHFHLHLFQAPHMELPQTQLAFNPGVTKLHDSSTATILFAGFLASHLLAKCHHHRAFFGVHHRTAALLVVWAALRFARTGLAIFQPGFVDVVNNPWSPLALSHPTCRGCLLAATLLYFPRCCRQRSLIFWHRKSFKLLPGQTIPLRSSQQGRERLCTEGTVR